MEKFVFENQGVNTYLVYKIGESEEIDSMSLGMLTNNKIPGFAPVIFQQMDADKFIKYNISAKVSVKQFFTGPVNRKRLIGVFRGIVDAVLSAEDYMIDVASLLLDLEYIYTDVSTCETVLICVPIVPETENQIDLGAFFKNIVFSTQFDQTENCDYVAKLINYLNGMPVFSLPDFKKVLDEIEQKEKESSGGGQPLVEPQQKPQVNPMPQQNVQQPQKTIQQAPLQINASKQELPKGQPAGGKSIPKSSMPQGNIPQRNIPQARTGSVPSKAMQPQVKIQGEEQEKSISWMYLMQHYNKENAAIYKAQKERKKQQKGKGTKPQAPQANVPMQQSASAQNIPQSTSIPKSTPIPQQKPITTAPAPANPVQSTMPPQMVTGSANFGETTVLGGNTIGETTVLNAAQQSDYQPKPYLIRTKNNERILLDKPVFRIGKEKSYVDYFIGDNTAISRSHASIITRDGEFYIVDTNSTNHTYVNDVMLQSNAETKISGGTKIRLANEEFEFKLL